MTHPGEVPGGGSAARRGRHRAGRQWQPLLQRAGPPRLRHGRNVEEQAALQARVNCWEVMVVDCNCSLAAICIIFYISIYISIYKIGCDW